MPRVRILSTGGYVPSRTITNAYFDDYYGEDVSSFLVARRNIHERHWAAEGENPSDLAAAAVQQALERAGLPASELGLLIVATDTPDYLSPSTAAIVQHKIGATQAGTFDLNTACAGFVTALETGRRFLEAAPAQYRYVAVVGVYLMSRFLDFRVRNVTTLFGDGAGAVILGPAPDDSPSALLTSRLETQGQYAEYMGIYAGGAACPASAQVVAAQEHLLQFRTKFPNTFNQDNWSRLARHVTGEAGLATYDVDLFIFTQINIESIVATMEVLNLPMERTHNVMDRFGYTGSACVPMALNDAWEKGRLKSGDLVCLIATGGGSALAASLLRW